MESINDPEEKRKIENHIGKVDFSHKDEINKLILFLEQ